MRLTIALFMLVIVTGCAKTSQKNIVVPATVVVVSDGCVGTLNRVTYELSPCEMVITVSNDSDNPPVISFRLFRRQHVDDQSVTTLIRYQSSPELVEMDPVDPRESEMSSTLFTAECSGFQELRLPHPVETIIWIHIWHADNPNAILIVPLRLIVVPPPAPTKSQEMFDEYSANTHAMLFPSS